MSLFLTFMFMYVLKLHALIKNVASRVFLFFRYEISKYEQYSHSKSTLPFSIWISLLELKQEFLELPL